MHADVFKQLLTRDPESHKYQFGHVLVVGGSPGMVGAPLLAAWAALRTGAGLVTVASEQVVVDKWETQVHELMTFAIPPSRSVEAVQSFMTERKVSVVIIGSGMRPGSADLIRELIRTIELPVIIDGGGLSALQEHLDILELCPSQDIVLTPHMGEFQKFYADPLPRERSELKAVAKGFSKKHAITLVLKGSPTYVTQPDGAIYENSTGNPGLATAGTGDVLAGVISGIAAQGITTGKAVATAVYLHGLAGDIASEANTQPGMTATDVIESIPAAYKVLSTR